MIREYTQADNDELINIWLKASLLAHPFLDSEFIDKEKKNIREVYLPNTKTWVYINNNILEGFISMIDNEVGALFVSPQKHRNGIGKALMNHVSLLHNELEVEVFKKNIIGRGFYDSYGFKFIQEHIHEETNNILLRMKYSK